MSAAMLKRIVAILVVALLVWGGLALLNRTREDSAGGLLLPALPADSVERVYLGRAPDTVLLLRSAAGWTVNGFPAAGAAVTSFLAAASDSTARGALIAQSPNSHGRLGLDTAQARRLTVSGAGGTLLDLYVGNRGPDFEGFYVRRTGEDAAYLLRGEFAEALSRDVAEWRDRQILAVPPDSIAGVIVRRGSASYTLARTGGSWTVGGAAADSVKVSRFLAQFGDVRASGYPEAAQLDSIPFSPAEREVALLGADGRLFEALTFDSAEAGFWVRNAAGVVYRVNQATVDRVTVGQEDLR